MYIVFNIFYINFFACSTITHLTNQDVTCIALQATEIACACAGGGIISIEALKASDQIMLSGAFVAAVGASSTIICCKESFEHGARRHPFFSQSRPLSSRQQVVITYLIQNPMQIQMRNTPQQPAQIAPLDSIYSVD